MEHYVWRAVRKEEIIGMLLGFLHSFKSNERDELHKQSTVVEKFIAEWRELE